MFRSRQIVVVGHATSLFLLLSYVFCIGFGLLGSYAYGWFIAVLWVPLYEFFDRRDRARQ